MERPFIDRYWPKLEAEAEAAWEDPVVLQLILDELLFRKRAGAQKLRARVTERVRAVMDANESFFWPSTAAMPSTKAFNGDHFSYSDGMLSFMGYRVGMSGVPASNRRDILVYVFNERLPRVNSVEYMDEWSRPKSGRRLKKLANSIANFARQAKRNRHANMAHAVSDWEEDLAYLKREFYDGRFDFGWPRSDA